MAEFKNSPQKSFITILCRKQFLKLQKEQEFRYFKEYCVQNPFLEI